MTMTMDARCGQDRDGAARREDVVEARCDNAAAERWKTQDVRKPRRLDPEIQQSDGSRKRPFVENEAKARKVCPEHGQDTSPTPHVSPKNNVGLIFRKKTVSDSPNHMSKTSETLSLVEAVISNQFVDTRVQVLWKRQTRMRLHG